MGRLTGRIVAAQLDEAQEKPLYCTLRIKDSATDDPNYAHTKVRTWAADDLRSPRWDADFQPHVEQKDIGGQRGSSSQLPSRGSVLPWLNIYRTSTELEVALKCAGMTGQGQVVARCASCVGVLAALPV